MNTHLIQRRLNHKLLMFLLFTTYYLPLHAQAKSQQSSEKKVTIQVRNTPIKEIFKSITQQTGFYFMGSHDQFNLNERITLSVKEEKLEDVLEKILTHRGYTWSIKESVITILKKININSSGRPTDTMITVKGSVTSEDGIFLPGATILAKPGRQGTTTNANGQFTLSNIPDRSVVSISYTGYETQEFLSEGSEILIVKLKKIIGALDESIVIAYGSSSRRLLTGNISRITSKEIGKQPISNPLQALQGRVPGMQITQTTGIAGSGFTVRVRGQNSIANGNDPLYVVDGVPYTSTPLTDLQPGINIFGGFRTSPLNYISPSDIASIEVLKDADATSIYGSRGANGVVLITTKQGSIGKTKLDVNVYSGTGKITRRLKLLNTRQYLDMRYEAFQNDGIDFTSSTANAPDLKYWDTTRYTDWQKELIGGTAQMTNVQASLSGGNENTNFRLGTSYSRESAVFRGNFADKKASVSLNLNHQSLDNKVKVQISINYLNDVNTLPNKDLTLDALKLPPVAPTLFTSDGKLNWQNSTWTNPATYLLSKYQARTNNLIGNVNIRYQIIRDLQLKTSLGYTTTNLKEINAIPQSAQNPANAPQSSTQFASNEISTWIIEPQVEYSKILGASKFNILLGSTFQQNTSQGIRQTGRGFSSDALIENLQAAATIIQNSYDYRIYRYNALFGRINYNLRNKYILNLTGRRDGSSRFGPGKQFANFGSIGAAWIFTNESIVQRNASFLSFGKLRGSYGTTGNDQLNDYEFLGTYSPVFIPYQGSGLSPTNLSNPDFRWEENRKIEVAIDLGFLQDRILFSTSYYRNRTSNQLVGYPLAPTAGFSTIQFNLPAVTQNTGWEFELNTQNIKGNASWETSINVTIPNNKLVAYPNLEGSSYATQYIVGQPLTIQRGYGYMSVDPITGLYTFKDYNSDGAISFFGDRESFVNISQRYFGGIQNRVSYIGIELDFLFQFVEQKGRNYIAVMGAPPGYFINQPVSVLNHRWHKSGDDAVVQKFSQNLAMSGTPYSRLGQSNAGYSDASFIRLKNLSLAYNLPSDLVGKLRVERCRIFLQGQNLLTFTDFLGMDPENNMVNSLPPLKMLTAGVSLTL